VGDNIPEAQSNKSSLVLPMLFGMGRAADVTDFFIPNLREQFPELTAIPEFGLLSDRELYFCWCLGCPNSPYKDINPALKRMETVLALAYTDKHGNLMISENELRHYRKLELPQRIEDAVKRMKAFDARLRYKAQMALREGVENLIDMITLSPEQKATMTIEDIKKYGDLLNIMMTKMPENIRSIESINLGFVMRPTNKGQRDSEVNFVGQAMKLNAQQRGQN
jgi:hypothetical protein